MMPSIELRGVTNFICRHIDLRIEDGELLVLLGPTGAGKTTLLNVIAGLAEYNGSVLLDGSPIDDTPPHQRGIGYLFQDLALFPHLDVSANITYGLKVQKRPPAEIMTRLKELLRLMRIEHLAHCFPRDLSGGERQKVALARALAPSPQILLLDEPLSNLDLRTSKYLRIELKSLQSKLGITTIYVTHNQREAEELGDRIAVIYQGTLQQVGTPQEIFFNPQNEHVSEFIGSPNILPCKHCREIGQGLMEINTGGLTIIAPYEGTEVNKIAISPRDIYISAEKPPGPDLNRFKGVITEIDPSPPLTRIKLEVGDHTLLAEVPTQIGEEMDLEVGKEVYLILKLRWIKTLIDHSG